MYKAAKSEAEERMEELLAEKTGLEQKQHFMTQQLDSQQATEQLYAKAIEKKDKQLKAKEAKL
jgi:hypothetical protein